MAQYCCAALVAAGIGLNIQNAIADYGIGENSNSLVATGGSGSSGSCVESLPYSSCTYSTVGIEVEEVIEIVKRCGEYAGKWGVRVGKVVGVVGDFITFGTIVYWIWDSQQSHYFMQLHKRITDETDTVILPDGNIPVVVPVYELYSSCDELDGYGRSNCQNPGWEQHIGYTLDCTPIG